MVARLIGMAMLAGVGWYVFRPSPTSERAFGESGIPWAPDLLPEPPPPAQPGDGNFLDWIKDFSLMSLQPRGIRNHNPGNIEYNGTRWLGMDDPPHDGRFIRFTEPVYGIRALARVLGTYYQQHGLDTVRGLINRWAPDHENDTNAYVAHVADFLNVEPDTPIDVMRWNIRQALVRAIIKHENGKQPYRQTLIERGVGMA